MTLQRRYAYVGSKDVRRLLERNLPRYLIESANDVLHWIDDSRQVRSREKTVIATFIIDIQQRLWVNDRRSEHIVCAAGEDVLSAGEMTFAIHHQNVEVVEVTNQSTGFCPEPESWWAVESALERIGLPHPDDFTTSFLFRRCDNCKTTNIIKDMVFECAVCQAPLSQQWNYAE
jgi:hypothetical protein